jgi:homoserine trans-succinylase
MKYVSKCENQVLTIKPNRNQIVDGIVVSVPGEHVRFHNNEYETDDKKIIDWLSKHRLKGTAFVEAQIEMAVK